MKEEKINRMKQLGYKSNRIKAEQIEFNEILKEFNKEYDSYGNPQRIYS